MTNVIVPQKVKIGNAFAIGKVIIPVSDWDAAVQVAMDFLCGGRIDGYSYTASVEKENDQIFIGVKANKKN